MLPSRLVCTTISTVLLLTSADASAQSRPQSIDEQTPYLLLSGFMSSDRILGLNVADSTRAFLVRRLASREVYLIPRRVIESTFTFETPSGPWPLGDICELAKVLHASALIDVRASHSSDGRVHLQPILVVGSQRPVDLPTIDAANVRAARDAVRPATPGRFVRPAPPFKFLIAAG